MHQTRLLPLLALLTACGGAKPEATSAPAAEDTTGAATSPTSEPAESPIAAALKGPQRSEENRARDPYRHPAETLAFFGLAPHMTVVEIRPGGGWYAEILAPALKEKGKYVAAVPSADGKRAKYRQRFIDMQAERADVLGAAEIVTFDPPTPIDLGPDGSADMVLTFRNTHNWIGDGGEKEAYAAFFRVLKPGGILGVVQHRADDGADPKQSAKKGYVPESYVIEVAQAAGFRLVDRSDINRNPKDTHDHPEGVWTLPPVLRLGDTDRAKYEAIGESDRMTLKFEKPL